MLLNSKYITLAVLGATALIITRVLFFLINDTQGPNLLIVTLFGIAIFILSLVVLSLIPARIQWFQRLAIVFCMQVLSGCILYLRMR